MSVLLICSKQHSYNFRIVEESAVSATLTCFCGASLRVIDEAEIVSASDPFIEDVDTVEMVAMPKSEAR